MNCAERGTHSPRYRCIRCLSLTHCEHRRSRPFPPHATLPGPPSSTLVYCDRYLYEETNRRKDGAVLVALNTAFDADDEPLLAPTSFMVASTVKTFNEAFCSEYVSCIYGRSGGGGGGGGGGGVERRRRSKKRENRKSTPSSPKHPLEYVSSYVSS